MSNHATTRALVWLARAGNAAGRAQTLAYDAGELINTGRAGVELEMDLVEQSLQSALKYLREAREDL